MAHLVSDDLWAAVEPLLSLDPLKPKGGRPRTDHRAALASIVFLFRTGCPWRDVPSELGGSGKTCWRRLCAWHVAGVWDQLHRVLLERLAGAHALDWSRAALDSASLPAKKGGAETGPNPTIRGQAGDQGPHRHRPAGHAVRPESVGHQPIRQHDVGAVLEHIRFTLHRILRPGSSWRIPLV